MSNYVDGFAHPIQRDRLEAYKTLATAAAEIWKEHGALTYWECVGDDMNLEGTGSFVEMLSAKEDEVVLFGWLVFESREARDHVGEKVAADPRMAKLMSESDTGFDPSRMAYGGFEPFVSS